MSRRKRYSTASASTGGAATAASTGTASSTSSFGEWLRKATEHKKKHENFKAHELTFVLRTLATLLDNGVSLPKALSTLAKEESLDKHREVLETLRRKVESGVTFSNALSQFSHICDNVTISQLRVGEQSGTLSNTLKQLSESRNKTAELKKAVIKKLAYPILLVVFGSGLITFLLLYVIPVFEETYEKAKVPLPFITRLLIGFGAFMKSYGWIVICLIAVLVTIYVQLRKQPRLAEKIDRSLLKLPLFGNWLRDIAVLQMMDVLHHLMAAGYTLAEALRETGDTVGNRAMKHGVHDLQFAVQRGERFSREIERLESLFPPIVHQLVIIGESTGKLTRATNDICDHLRREIERKTEIMVGALEPILTIGLAVAIAMILMAIYLPMFDMVNTVS